MRKGDNPSRNKAVNKKNSNGHRVIIPLFIPHLEGYYKDAFKIFKMSLSSIMKTSLKGTKITVSSNGSCKEVENFLENCYKDGYIHELIMTSSNIGKMNAILKAVAGNNEDLFTITDADVLFLNKWQTAVLNVYNLFPKAGAVCTSPSSRSFKKFTGNIWLKYLLSKKLKFDSVTDKKSLQAFAKSVNNPNMYNDTQLKKILKLFGSDDQNAVIGAGHFSCTYRKDIFNSLPVSRTKFILGGGDEALILDYPVIKQGYWRLSTPSNWTLHLGNTYEPWMLEKLNDLKVENGVLDFVMETSNKESPRSLQLLLYKLIEKMLKNKTSGKILLQLKGLSKKEAKDYLN